MPDYIDIYEVEVDNRVIKSVGKCPACQSEVEYLGKQRALDYIVRGTGFIVEVGRCVKCHREYQITSE